MTFCANAQEMKVNSVTSDITDLSAKMNPRYASDGSPCALLKKHVLNLEFLSKFRVLLVK